MKTIAHDVVSIYRLAPKSGNVGLYGTNWWNAYIPIDVMKKLTAEITKVTGYTVNQDGMIMDLAQELCSVTMNVKSMEQSPKVTLFVENEEEVADADNPGSTVKKSTMMKTDMSTLAHIMDVGGEDSLIGGMGFISFGLLCKGHVSGTPPPVGSLVKLSFKLQGQVISVNGAQLSLLFSSEESTTSTVTR